MKKTPSHETQWGALFTKKPIAGLVVVTKGVFLVFLIACIRPFIIYNVHIHMQKSGSFFFLKFIVTNHNKKKCFSRGLILLGHVPF